MKNSVKPMHGTILFGIISGLTFMPMTMALSYVLSWPLVFRLSIWFYLSCYAFLLTWWGKGTFKNMIFPLLLIFITGMFGNGTSVFLLQCLCVLSWIRSSLGFQKSAFLMLLTELVLSLGGGILGAFLAPQTQIGWALGIWLFFLVQSLYFVSWEGRNAIEGEKQKEVDPFERASRQVERILSTRLLPPSDPAGSP